MSVNAPVKLSETNKSEKPLKPLFSKREECSHVSCYWCVYIFLLVIFTGHKKIIDQFASLVVLFHSEENVWKLCEDVSVRVPEELDTCYVVFISNPCRTVPLWKQRAGREEDRLVIWVCI